MSNNPCVQYYLKYLGFIKRQNSEYKLGNHGIGLNRAEITRVFAITAVVTADEQLVLLQGYVYVTDGRVRGDAIIASSVRIEAIGVGIVINSYFAGGHHHPFTGQADNPFDKLFLTDKTG